jgi:hypothetical protein
MIRAALIHARPRGFPPPSNNRVKLTRRETARAVNLCGAPRSLHLIRYAGTHTPL